MNFKSVSIVLTILSINLLALSSPVQNDENVADSIDVSINGVKSQNINDIYLIDKDEATDISSDEEEVILDNFVEEVSEIDSSDEDENICYTKECIEVSNNLLNSIDTTIDPCEDFYQFTCGNYIKNNPVSESKPGIKVFNSAESNNEERLHKVIKGEYKPNKNLSKQAQEYDEIIFNKLKSFYNSCMDIDTILKKGGKPLINLMNILKISENKNKYKDPNELAKMFSKIKLYSVYVLPLFNIAIDLNENASFTVPLLSKSYSILIGYKDKNELKEYKEFLSSIYKDMDRDIDKMVDSVFDFEKKLIEIIGEYNYQYYNSSPEILTLKSLNEKCPNINWKTYFEEIFNSVGLKNEITDDFIIHNSNVSYFEDLNKLLNEVDSETLSYYFEIYIIENYSVFLPDSIEKFNYKESNVDRSKKCYNSVSQYMDDALTRYFVEFYFTESKKQYSEKVIEYITQSMINRIPNVEWLDDETIEYALKKMKGMKSIIGYRDSTIKPEILIEKYDQLDISEDEYFNNIVSIHKYKNKDYLKLINTSKDEVDIIYLPPQTINAYYNVMENAIYIPAGILQPPFFSSGIPDYINYGGIGSVIGHEITHGFDNLGKNFDINGDYLKWWTDNDIEEYEDTTKCFINQYNEFSILDNKGQKHNVNGENTLNENIADNGGLARAFEAWKLSLLEENETVRKENQKLPGLTQFTPEQLFFISFGHQWCENFIKNESLVESFVRSTHSPGFARVNGVVSNSKQFAEVFNCPLRSKMNPENKCSIW